MKNFNKTILATLLIAFLAISCEEEQDDELEFPPVDRGNVSADAYLLLLEDIKTARVDTFGYGALSQTSAVSDTIVLDTAVNSTRRYEYSILYFNNGQNVTASIKQQATSYVNCFREFDTRDIRIIEESEDNNGDKLGLDGIWAIDFNANTPGTGRLKITLNYNSLRKQGDACDPGVRIFEASVPYKIDID